ncbi:MAG: hypothetical protein HQM16_18280 [Deltaproteobacteria bacterium]|nr:hypothetical protein [Deltaproteobacteria bacterium]
MKYQIAHTFDPKSGRHTVNGFHSVLHCHHYTVLTTQLAFDAKHFAGEKLLLETAENTFFNVLGDYFAKNNITNTTDMLSIAEDYWRTIGMGIIKFTNKGALTAEMDYSHIDEGWLKKCGGSDRPVNLFSAGLVSAVAALINNKTTGSFSVNETKSLAMGDDVSAFEVLANPQAQKISPIKKITHNTPETTLSLSLPTHVDRLKVIAELSKIKVTGNEQGMIPLFGVYLQQLPIDFWNTFAQRLITSVSPDMIETAEYLLRNCAHECGYHTGYGIITSTLWNEIIKPMIKDVPADILHGALAVFAAWGWALCEITELKPNEKMIVRAYNYYESDVQATRPAAYMIQGVSAAFMDLAYGGKYDVTGKTGMKTFECRQTKGIEIGDPYGEFVVTRCRRG